MASHLDPTPVGATSHPPEVAPSSDVVPPEVAADAPPATGGPRPEPRSQPSARAGTRSGRDFAAAAGALAGRVANVLAAPLLHLVHLWRRSIQARVVIGTLTLSAVLAMLAGWVLLSRVTDGLLESKRDSALSQAATGVVTAQGQLDGDEPGDFFDAGRVLPRLIELLSPREAGSQDYGVVITGPTNTLADLGADGGVLASGSFAPKASIPPEVMAKVQAEEGTWWAYSKLHFEDSTVVEPGLVVGSQLRVPDSGDTYSLFYLFPLEEQQQTLFVVRSALITTGAVLVVMLGTIGWLVTRQVVTPVRLARRIAERLAGGRLEERMHVRGEDDIARLSVSFNKMAANLQRHIRRLEELSRVQRRFVADVSHELRTPLTTVRMAADLLHDQRASFDPATARSAELLQAELNRFEGLLTDLLEISRFDAGAAVLELSDVDLRDVVTRVVDASSAHATRRGSAIEVDLPPTPCLVEVDVRRVERILRNLVVNALEYGEGRRVEVRVAGTGEAVAVSVRDHGIGLMPGEDVLVFSRFWRADPARARTHGGTGLGLAIAVEDSTLHGGRLDAWGRPGVGSVFRLTLPRRAGAPLQVSPLPLRPGIGQLALPLVTATRSEPPTRGSTR